MLLLFTLLLAPLTHADNCLEDFRARLNTTNDNQSRKALINELNKDQLECLFVWAENHESPQATDMVPEGQTGIVRFMGKNSLVSVVSQFEKHFFRNWRDHLIYGYNSGWINRNLCAPGFFRSEEGTGATIYDYTLDFPAMIDANQLHSIGAEAQEPIKATDGALNSLLFSGLQDVMWKISADSFIGKALKNGEYKSYFILVRIP